LGSLLDPIETAMVRAWTDDVDLRASVKVARGAAINRSDPHKSINAVTRRGGRAEIYCAFRYRKSSRLRD
jgi:hypothetical protein